ncbi:unnamed protein product [Cuscuta campestris]|uniref:Uncharacterized protein n=1 Tax=Cuscuta campestris TaxID=132261 RepID=A0A484KVX5_9ASTE|nr:unnamed protein product [Cuscuta campestris]
MQYYRKTHGLERSSFEKGDACSARVSMTSDDALNEISLSKSLEKKHVCLVLAVNSLLWHSCKEAEVAPKGVLQDGRINTYCNVNEAGMCMLSPGREVCIPRCLKWKVCAKFSAGKVADALFKSEKSCLPEHVIRRRGSGDRSDGAVLTEDGGEMASKQGGDDEVDMVGFGSVGGNDMAYGSNVRKEERIQKHACEHKELMKVMLEIMAKQAEQDKKIDQILVMLQQKDEVKDDDRENLENDEEIMVIPNASSFEILTPMAKDGGASDGNKINGSGSVLVAEGSHAEECYKPSEIPFGDTQISPHDLELIDKATEMLAKSFERRETISVATRVNICLIEKVMIIVGSDVITLWVDCGIEIKLYA